MDKQRTVINAEWLATEVASIIFNQGKAKLFNVLESQIDTDISATLETRRLRATKRITEDIISGIAKNVANLIRDALHDWEEEVEIGPDADLTPEEIQALKEEYGDIDKILE